jgi:hypothetical protein
METKIAEIAPGIYRLSTWVAEILPPDGFTFNQFLVAADEPLLFHCGQRKLPDESGAMKVRRWSRPTSSKPRRSPTAARARPASRRRPRPRSGDLRS